MIFKQLFDQDTSTYTYLIADKKTKQAALIDPVKEHVNEYLNLLDQLGLKLEFALDTHVHADHVTASGILRERTGCETCLHENTKAECVSIRLKDKDILELGDLKIKVLHTPGHTPCHVAYLIEDRLFTGDCLFINGCGRTDFQEGSAEEQWNSLQKLFELPNDVLVYPGHDYKQHHVSTIAQEKDLNPRLAGKTKEEFIEIMNNLNLPEPKHLHVAVPANVKCGLE